MLTDDEFFVLVDHVLRVAIAIKGFVAGLDPPAAFQKIIDEISSDASLYGAIGNDCQGIIAFIWDDSAQNLARRAGALR